MEATTPTMALPVHEFPDAPLLLRDWKTTYLEKVLGEAALGKVPLDDILYRMHHLHISSIRWYKTTIPLDPSGRPRTFELASGSQWGSDGQQDLPQGEPAHLHLHAEHEHHHLIAEVTLPTSAVRTPAASEPRESDGVVMGAVLGSLLIEGTCRLDMPLVHEPAIPPRVTDGQGPDTSLIQAALFRTLPRPSNAPSRPTPFVGSADGSTADVDTTPIARRFSPMTAAGDTPTRGTSIRRPNFSDGPESSGARHRSDEVDFPTTSLAGGSRFTQEPATTPSDLTTDELADAVADRLDLSYLDKRSNSLRSFSSSSPQFISPWASRSNSISRSRGGSTDTIATRPNSRSNSSNATSFTTTSSISSAGLVFSDNRGVPAVLAGEVEARFIVKSLDQQFNVPFAPGSTEDGVPDEECVLELSFPPNANQTSPRSSDDGPQGFFTLRDLSILAHAVERSLKDKTLVEGDPSTSFDDSASESAFSERSAESGPSEISLPTSNASTCCCEFYKRLFAVIPRVSGLRAVEEVGSVSHAVAGASSAMAEFGGGLAAKHFEEYAHHGGYLRAPFLDQAEEFIRPNDAGFEAIGRVLGTKFEQRKRRFERELLRVVKSSGPGARSAASTEDSELRPLSDAYRGRPVQPIPKVAIEEARDAAERFRRAVRESDHAHQTEYVDA
ncbi:hypothetical protein DFP72DRAFT_285443 [Ephemerocybe angulata]|uniref:Uncharacterized protein n=1 Tax=Ephemerocybe angulata TaxID=980116 RepID=A0A8H6I1R0_9AGAR|nr:hypothetical protein DFP72DRAFT_285443 [Tulosesus angulatus]